MQPNKLLPKGNQTMLTNREQKNLQSILKKYVQSLAKISLVPSEHTKYMSNYTCSSEGEFKSLMEIENQLEEILSSSVHNISELIKKRKNLLVILKYLKRVAALEGKACKLVIRRVLRELSDLVFFIRILENISSNLCIFLYRHLRTLLLKQGLSLQKN